MKRRQGVIYIGDPVMEALAASMGKLARWLWRKATHPKVVPQVQMRNENNATITDPRIKKSSLV